MVTRLICLTDVDRTALLPQFLQHYQDLGVQEMHLAVHFNSHEEMTARRDDLDRCVGTIKDHGGLYEGSICFPYDARIARAYLDHLVQDNKADPSDWIVWVDSDEFQLYGRPITECISEWEKANIDAVEGFFVDRVSQDGLLSPFDPARPVWDQYPICCNFTEKVLGAYAGKLVCARGWVRIDDGNHRVASNQYARRAPDLVPLHHFKWTDEVRARLQRRITPEWRRTKFWWRESQRGIDHIHEHGGIDLSSVDILTPQGDLIFPAQGLGPKSSSRFSPRAQ
jgi:hypothetical protein